MLFRLMLLFLCLLSLVVWCLMFFVIDRILIWFIFMRFIVMM